MKKAHVKKFWIREMSGIRGTNLKSVTIEFYSTEDAHNAHRILQGFQYVEGNNVYSLSARIEDWGSSERSPSPYRRREHRERMEGHRGYERFERRRSRERERSRSPHLSREASKLDLEIELLRKQRMIIEEERRLVLERKKLELVKEYGPDAIKEFDFIEGRDRRHRAEQERKREEYRPRRRTPPPPRPRERHPPPRHSHQYIRKSPPPPSSQAFLPNFFAPCKFIVNEMRQYFKDTEGKENFLLLKVLRTAVRKRLAIMLEDKPRMSTKDILLLYREHHSKDTDEDFVKKHLSDVKACQEPKSVNNANKKKDASTIPIVKKENNDKGRAEDSVTGDKEKADTDKDTDNKKAVIKIEGTNLHADGEDKDMGTEKVEMDVQNKNMEDEAKETTEKDLTESTPSDTMDVNEEGGHKEIEQPNATSKVEPITEQTDLKQPIEEAVESEVPDNDVTEEWAEGEEWTAEEETEEPVADADTSDDKQ